MIDKKDKLLLDVLKKDASLSTYKIAKKTLIPQTTVLHRIRKLRAAGIIKRYTIDIDVKKIEKKVKALIFVKVEKKSEKQAAGKVGDLEKKLFTHSFISSIKRLMGKSDFVIEVVCRDIEELNDFLINKVRTLDSVADTETVVVLDEWEK